MPNWGEVLNQIQRQVSSSAAAAQGAVDIVRRSYLKQLHEHTGRNIIAYYSGFLSKPEIQSEINDEDKNGFMMAVHKLDRKLGLDLILHTPGGSIAATQSIVNYLQRMFGPKNIRTVVPQIAMSAGTMIACASTEILMTKHSNLGPIDPHLRGVPAYGVIREFRRACREVKKDSSKVAIWSEIISQYRPTFLSQCENAIKWSNEFVSQQLQSVMFAGRKDAKGMARTAVRKLTDYSGNKGHDRHFHIEDCKAIGLKVTEVEKDQDLQDLLLTVHHCYMHSLMNTPSYKMIENHEGTAFVKQKAQRTGQ